MTMPAPPTLLLCAPAPVIDAPLGYRLDVKFVEGMRAHAAGWGGPMQCVLWRGAGAIPFGRAYLAAELGFDLTVLDPGAPLPGALIEGASVVMVSADMPGFDGVVTAAAQRGRPVVTALEYTLETRLRILWLDRDTGLLRKARRALWALRNERRIRRALRASSGVQFNGYPAFDAYRGLTGRPLLYLDNRMSPALMATPEDMAARAARLRSGAPLRLIHSGRLEAMKGAQDLLPVMARLRQAGVAATLDIYGTGALEGAIRDGLGAFDGAVRLHGPVDFETGLVPVSRTQADVFLSCHRQSDPSCTYLEAMGCGLAVAGFGNRMWARLSAEAGLGAPVALGDGAGLAAGIAAWDRDREALIAAAERGLGFARAHDFPREFDARMAHLQACASIISR